MLSKRVSVRPWASNSIRLMLGFSVLISPIWISEPGGNPSFESGEYVTLLDFLIFALVNA